MKRTTKIDKVLLLAVIVVSQLCGLDFSAATSYDHYFADKWQHPYPGVVPAVSVNDTVYSGVPLSLYVVVKEYARNAFGIADVSFSYKIMGPNGRVYLDTTGFTACKGVVAADAGVLLSTDTPKITLSRKDTFGVYTLLITVDDRITETKKTVEKKLLHAKLPAVEPDKFDAISLNIWIHNYCITPDPARAVAAYFAFINSPSSNNERIFWPVCYFFQALFYNNPVLVEQLVTACPNDNARLKEYTVFILRAIQAKRRTEWPITDALWKKFDQMTTTGYLDPFEVTMKSKTVQFMEFGFYYYGRYDMIRFLAGCLNLDTPDGRSGFNKNSKAYRIADTLSLDTETAQRFCEEAHAILSKTYSKHALVHAYCNYAVVNDNLLLPARGRLREIVDPVKKQP